MSLIIKSSILYRKCTFQLLISSNEKIFNRIFSNETEILVPRISAKHFSTNVIDNEKDELIYHGMLSKHLRYVKYLSLSTSFATLLIQPFLLSEIHQKTSSIGMTIGVGLACGLFAFITPAILHFISKKYVVKIYYNKDNNSYTAVTYSLFVRENKLNFTPEDVYQPEMNQFLANCIIHGHPLFFDQSNFKDPNFYRIIMNYDKPMNFQVEVDTKSDKSMKKQSSN